MNKLRLLVALVLAAFLVMPLAGQADRRTKNIDPYKVFKFRYTAKKPDTRTSFDYHVELKLPTDGSRPPVVEHLTLRFAKGTKVDLGAVPACKADDATLTAEGPDVCPARGRIATGPSAVSIGPGPLLNTNTVVFVTGRNSIAVVLDVGGNVVAILRGTVTGTRLELPVPPREVAPGVRAALVKFKLKIGGGSAKKPVFKTPATCPKGGWPVVYAPRFDTTRAKLTYWTSCRA